MAWRRQKRSSVIISSSDNVAAMKTISITAYQQPAKAWQKRQQLSNTATYGIKHHRGKPKYSIGGGRQLTAWM